MTSTKFQQWMRINTAGAKRDLAARAGTTVPMLYQLSSGLRNASSALALRIDAVASNLTAGDLNKTCAECKYFKKCKN
jgi:hypothetical protein